MKILFLKKLIYHRETCLSVSFVVLLGVSCGEGCASCLFASVFLCISRSKLGVFLRLASFGLLPFSPHPLMRGHDSWAKSVRCHGG